MMKFVSGLRIRLTALLSLSLVLCALDATARVIRVEVLSRASIAGDAKTGRPEYERITARVHFAVKPADVHNKGVVDLDKAPVNLQGEVEFSSDLLLIRPLIGSNGAMLLEIPNRGGKGMLSIVDGGKGDPASATESGDGWLLRQGFTYAALGWQWDVVPDAGNLRLYAPVAHYTGSDRTSTITGILRDDFTPSEAASDWPLGHVMGTHLGGVEYAVADPNDARDVLTVRDEPHGKRAMIPRSEWSFTHGVDGKLAQSDRFIHLNSGFAAGKIYELVYVVRDPVVAGLGFAAVRDFASWMKHSPEALAPVKVAYAAGISQCGRFLRDFLYEGFNADESGLMALDGVLAHVGGAGRGSFNYRFAQPSRDGQPMSSIDYPTDIFPFTDSPEIDPAEPQNGAQGLLDTATKEHVLPKIFFSHTSYEYWGRAASLIHTTADGKADATIGANVRIYFFSGLQHFSVPFPPQFGTGDRSSQQLPSPLPIRWFWRAMIANMDSWVRNGTAPPQSRYPRIGDGTLVPLEKLAFPAIPKIAEPKSANEGWDLDFGPNWRGGILSVEPPAEVRAYPTLVPQVDADGNDLGGIRLPEISVPLATYTGWNLRSPTIGAPTERTAFLGSFVPFRNTAANASADHDPRLAIGDRYKNYSEYRERLEAAANQLVKDGYILDRDRDKLLDQSKQEWEWTAQFWRDDK